MKQLLIMLLLMLGTPAFAALEVVGGSTNLLFNVSLYATDGTAKTGLVYSDMTITYTFNDDTSDHDIIEATMTMGTHVDGGFIEVDATNSPGLYQFGAPDAAIADGHLEVTFSFAAINVVPYKKTISLVDVDMRDSIRAGLIALPNAAADGAGGLPISDAGGLDLDAVLIGNVPQTGDSYARLGAPAGASVSADVAAIEAQIGVAGAGLTNLGDTRMANLDAAISTRLSAAGYTAPLDAAGVRTAVGLATANLDTQIAALPTVDAFYDEALSEHIIAGTGGKALSDILADTNELQLDDIPAILTTLATATSLATHDSKLDIVDSLIDAITIIANKLDSMIEYNAPNYQFTLSSLTNFTDNVTVNSFTTNALSQFITDNTGENIPVMGSVAQLSQASEEGIAAAVWGYSVRTVTGISSEPGSVVMTMTYTDSITHLPLINAEVIISTDAARTNILAAKYTNQEGKVSFQLSPGINLYRSVRATGYADVIGQQFTVVSGEE